MFIMFMMMFGLISIVAWWVLLVGLLFCTSVCLVWLYFWCLVLGVALGLLDRFVWFGFVSLDVLCWWLWVVCLLVLIALFGCWGVLAFNSVVIVVLVIGLWFVIAYCFGFLDLVFYFLLGFCLGVCCLIGCLVFVFCWLGVILLLLPVLLDWLGVAG